MQHKTSEFTQNFAKGLKYARIRRNLTQADVAKALNHGETVVANWEAGRNGPHRSKLGPLEDFFGVSIDPFTGEWKTAKKGLPAGTVYSASSGPGGMEPMATADRTAAVMSAEEFRNLADHCAVECHRRGHRLAARALMDLVDELDGLSDATRPKSSKVLQALEDLSKVRLKTSH